MDKGNREIKARSSIIYRCFFALSRIISASSRSARRVTQFRHIDVRTYLLRGRRVMCRATRISPLCVYIYTRQSPERASIARDGFRAHSFSYLDVFENVAKRYTYFLSLSLSQRYIFLEDTQNVRMTFRRASEKILRQQNASIVEKVSKSGQRPIFFDWNLLSAVLGDSAKPKHDRSRNCS